MKTYFVLFICICVGCGNEGNVNGPFENEEESVTSSIEAPIDTTNTITIDGLVIKGEEGVSIEGYDTSLIHSLIVNINNNVNKYYEGLDLIALIKQYQLVVSVYPSSRMSVGGLYMRGNHTIMLQEPNSNWDSDKQCLQMYYTLGHEILHFVDYVYLNNSNGHTSVSTSSEHVFFMGCNDYHKWIDTIEYGIWEGFSSVCGYDVNSLYEY